MKYILSLTARNPQNNMVLECDDEEEMNKYYKMAIQQGYKVTVKEEPEDKNLRKWIKINNFIESQIGVSPSSIMIDHTEEGRARRRQRAFYELLINLLQLAVFITLGTVWFWILSRWC